MSLPRSQSYMVLVTEQTLDNLNGLSTEKRLSRRKDQLRMHTSNDPSMYVPMYTIQ